MSRGVQSTRHAGPPTGRGVRVFVIAHGDGPEIRGLVREVAPAAEVISLDIFVRRVAATADLLERALAHALRGGARVVLLPASATDALGSSRVVERLRDAVRNRVVLVAPAIGGPRRLPPTLPDEVLGAAADGRLRERSLRFVRGANFECRAGDTSHAAAAARVSGAVACILESRPRARLGDVRAALEFNFAAPKARGKLVVETDLNSWESR
ncbi:MAG TPA: hypothetical protein VFP65_11650 [Anaeromyxobacteraceae bacterium]|nr:hypothetical protein [Anaeromyxobacteraceae bacterium]